MEAARQTCSGYLRSDSVSKWPAAAATTAIPSAAHSRASSRVRPSVAARAALEWTIPVSPWCGERVTLTIAPPPAGRIARSAAARAMFSVPPTLRLNTARQPLGSIASAGAKYCPPALLTNTSRRPWRSRTASTMRWAPSGSRMSPGNAEASSPISPTAASSTSVRRPAMATVAPHAASSRAAALPRPVPPPVTSATRPASIVSAKMREVATAEESIRALVRG